MGAAQRARTRTVRILARADLAGCSSSPFPHAPAAFLFAPPPRIVALQAEIERTRWHLTYHRNGRGVDIAGAAERPSAGEALVHHLISAAAKRQALARVTGGDAGAMLRCVDERLRRHDLTKAGRRRK